MMVAMPTKKQKAWGFACKKLRQLEFCVEPAVPIVRPSCMPGKRSVSFVNRQEESGECGLFRYAGIVVSRK